MCGKHALGIQKSMFGVTFTSLVATTVVYLHAYAIKLPEIDPFDSCHFRIKIIPNRRSRLQIKSIATGLILSSCNVLQMISGKTLRKKLSHRQIRDFKKNWCPTPKEVENGNIKTSCGRGCGRKATIKCHAGFVLRGKKKRVCMKNRDWSGMDPICLTGKLNYEPRR